MSKMADKMETKPEEGVNDITIKTEENKPVKNARGAGRKKGTKNSEESKEVRNIRKATESQVKAIEEASSKIRAQHVLDYLHENIFPKLEAVGETMKNIYENYNFKEQQKDKENCVCDNTVYTDTNEKYDPRNPEHRLKFTIKRVFKK